MDEKALRRRVGQAGLDNIMRDSRHTDGNHPEHGQIVDMLQRGFELVFDEDEKPANPRRRPAADTAPRARKFANAFERLAGDKKRLDMLPDSQLGATGRRMVLAALDDDGAALPPDLKEEARTPRRRTQNDDARTAPDENLPDSDDLDDEDELERADAMRRELTEVFDKARSPKEIAEAVQKWLGKYMGITPSSKLSTEAKQLRIKAFNEGISANVPGSQ
jgi:hypothetical protein